MKIKRFLAPDMRTALQHVRQEHGPDAVILSNRVTPEGVEIVAASQYDEDLVRDAAETAAPAATSAVSPDQPIPQSLVDEGRDHEDSEPVGMGKLTALTPLPCISAAPEETTSDPAADLAERSSHSPALAALLAQATSKAPVADPEPATQTAPAVTSIPAPTPAPVASLPPAPSVSPMPSAPITDPSASMPAATDPTLDTVIPVSPAAPAVQVGAASSPAPAVPARANADAVSTQLQEEFARMRQMLERGLNRMNDERLRCSPARQQVMDWMQEQGFTDEIVRDVAMAISADTEAHQVQAQASRLLGERLPIAATGFLEEGGAIALIGPSGAGKTSTVGKLAAYYSARHGVRDIALISLDHARPGGSDRLYCLARQLGIAAHEADSSQALSALLQRLQDYRVILIDSPGVPPRHPQAAEQLNWLRNAEGVRSLLVLPASTHPVDLDEMVSRFQPAEPQGVIVTRLDETRRPGGVLSVVAKHQLPLAWVSDGQHLHDDLHRAESGSLLQRLSVMDSPAPAPYDPVAALVANHAFA